MATSTLASASSPANIRPVGPPPAITTACSVIMPSISVDSLLQPTMMRYDQGLAASPLARDIIEVGGSGYSPLVFRCGLSLYEAAVRRGGEPSFAQSLDDLCR